MTVTATTLLTGFSMEVTGRDESALAQTATMLPPATRLNVTFLGNETPESRVAAVRTAKHLGLRPVPHLAARRLASRDELRSYLAGLNYVGGCDATFVIGGDPSEAMGPYRDALSVLESGELQRLGVKEVGIAGYPEGHPEITKDQLWRSLAAKVQTITESGMKATITTQFGFDTAPVVSWIQELRDRGIDSQVRVGTPGPAGVKRLLAYAKRFGIGANAMIVRKYGFSLTNLLGSAGPDRFISDLASELPQRVGEVGIHLYSFGGPEATAAWARNFLAAAVQ